jgi:hypothetical protein
VKEIVVNLAKAVGIQNGNGVKEENAWQPLPVERFLEDESDSRASKVVVQRKQYNLLFANGSNFSDG